MLFPGRRVHHRQMGGRFVFTVMPTGGEVAVLVPATSVAVAVKAVGARRHVGPVEAEARPVGDDSQAIGAREILHAGDGVREVSGRRANPDVGGRQEDLAVVEDR